MFPYFEPNFIEKFLWESGFQILAKIEMTRNKNRLFVGHFETVQHFPRPPPRIMDFGIAYIYGANFIAKFRWESGFLRGSSMDPPPLGMLGHQRE